MLYQLKIRSRNTILTVAVAAALTAISVTTVLAHDGATGIVKERMDRFSVSRDNMKAIYGMLKSGSTDGIAVHAASIKTWAETMQDYFPEGSNPSPSAALDAIWLNPEGFVLAAKANQIAAAMLEDAAMRGDLAAANDAFKTLGKTCSSCHRQFRK